MDTLTDKQKHTILKFGVWFANCSDSDVMGQDPKSFFTGYIVANGHSVFECDDMRYSPLFNEWCKP